MLSLLIISVVILIIVSVAVYFWLRSGKYSTLVSLMNRFKDDTSKPFDECEDLNAHLKLLKKELDQLLKNSENKDKTIEQIDEVLKRRVDPEIKGRLGIDLWIKSKLPMITARIGCIRHVQNDLTSKYISVKPLLEEVMVKLRLMMKNDFKSCDELNKIGNDIRSTMIRNIPSDRRYHATDHATD